MYVCVCTRFPYLSHHLLAVSPRSLLSVCLYGRWHLLILAYWTIPAYLGWSLLDYSLICSWIRLAALLSIFALVFNGLHLLVWFLCFGFQGNWIHGKNVWGSPFLSTCLCLPVLWSRVDIVGSPNGEEMTLKQFLDYFQVGLLPPCSPCMWGLVHFI